MVFGLYVNQESKLAVSQNIKLYPYTGLSVFSVCM